MLIVFDLNHITCLKKEVTPAKNILCVCKYIHLFDTRTTAATPTKTAVPPG